MKKATRLLILTAFVFPFLFTARAYAGGPRPGQPTVDPIVLHSYSEQHRDFLHNHDRHADGFPSDRIDRPLEDRDGIADPFPDMDRDNLDRRDDHHGHDQPANAPLDGGLGLLLAAGIGLGIRKARARKQSV